MPRFYSWELWEHKSIYAAKYAHPCGPPRACVGALDLVHSFDVLKTANCVCTEYLWNVHLSRSVALSGPGPPFSLRRWHYSLPVARAASWPVPLLRLR